MNTAEQKQLISELDSRWPLKFQDDELRVWANALSVYALVDVQHALAEFKSSHAYPPKIPEIKAMLPKLLTNNDARARINQAYRSTVTQAVVTRHAELMGLPESVILIRAYRALFRKREQERQTRRGDQELAIDLERERLERELHKELIRADVTMPEANRLSLMVDAPDEEFKETIDALTNPRSVTA